MDLTERIQRVAPLQNVVVRHPYLDLAYQGIQECVARTAVLNEPVGCLLLGQGGLGKTTICKALLKSMPQAVQHDATAVRSIVPAFYAQVPSPATVKSLAAKLLAKLNDPSPLSGTVPQLTDRLCKLLRNCETKLVLLDEFHHLIDVGARSTRVNTTVCNWVKSLVNETGVSFCLVGLPTFASIFTMDTQLARRFPMTFELPSLVPGTRDKPGFLERFLGTVSARALEVVRLDGFPKMEEHLFANQIYAATQGIPAFVMKLVRESILAGLASGSNEVTVDDFASAWDGGICRHSSLSNVNPFRLEEAALFRRLREVT